MNDSLENFALFKIAHLLFTFLVGERRIVPEITFPPAAGLVTRETPSPLRNIQSGCPELNWDHTHPKGAYCRYTTSRYRLKQSFLILSFFLRGHGFVYTFFRSEQLLLENCIFDNRIKQAAALILLTVLYLHYVLQSFFEG